ncbi:glutamyl-tRNA amidotransferase [Niveomyces insectorum RCEF 264]|uniref:Glutamyl-tRNA(Gln) amidotransferase subunit A, mitochondrial n=1 Tax=Niveomyces insectorum RCEF 264 TaxID=1081102 RepID=A0A167TG99_9HYPO|nr:glutamyl-tRNA amidotransferase [Niveomyces insectorum RCEF 264]
MPAHARQLGRTRPAACVWSAGLRQRPLSQSDRVGETWRRLSSTTAAPSKDAAPAPQPASAPDWNHFISRVPTPLPRTDHPHAFTLAVKDNIATRGTDLPTTCGSRMLAGYRSPFEATVVTQLRQRGAVLVGKTNLDEFGMGSHNLYSHWGPVAAPAAGTPSSSSSFSSSSLSVGGSSGGSAVAVRLGDADVALGTDTGGSVRLPAAYGGVVGYKPSYGMLSRFGVVPYANSLDTVGLLARAVAPIRRLIVGDDDDAGNGGGGGADGLWRVADTGRDPTSLPLPTRLRLAAQREGYGASSSKGNDKPLRGLSFGIPLEYNIAELDPRIRAAWVAAAAQLRALGADTVAAVALPSTRHALSAYYVLAAAEAASNLARYDGVRYGGVKGSTDVDPNGGGGDGSGHVLYERVRGAGLGPEVQQRILLGAYALSSAARDNYFLQAQRVRRRVVRDFDAVFRLANPLRDHDEAEESNGGGDDEDAYHIDLSDLPEGLPLANRRGPARVDFLLCPTAPTPAPRIADVLAASSSSPVAAYINDVFTAPASLAGLPAISIPTPPPLPSSSSGEATTAQSSSFCPGFQLIGQYWDDARLLRVAEAMMEASFRRPEDQEALAHHRQTGTAEA